MQHFSGGGLSLSKNVFDIFNWAVVWTWVYSKKFAHQGVQIHGVERVHHYTFPESGTAGVKYWVAFWLVRWPAMWPLVVFQSIVSRTCYHPTNFSFDKDRRNSTIILPVILIGYFLFFVNSTDMWYWISCKVLVNVISDGWVTRNELVRNYYSDGTIERF